jgi:DNA-binding HxlR family transcriptional regulator
MRSGARSLLLLAAPLNCLILKALSDGPKEQAELRKETGFPAQTTLRAQLKKLTKIGAVAKQRRNRFPGVLEYELAAAGWDLLSVAAALERWLEGAPDGPLRLGSDAAKAAIKALAEAWSTKMLRALAAGPLSLTELDRVISSLSYPSLERRLGAMRLAGQVEARAGNGRGTPYAVTEWLRRSVAPLAVAARWEHSHLPQDSAAIARIDAEAAFLLAIPLLRLPTDLSGCCRLAAEFPNGNGTRFAGVTIRVENGGVASCVTRLEDNADAWALGAPIAWLATVIEHDVDGLELGGERRLAQALLTGLHETLFEVRVRPH